MISVAPVTAAAPIAPIAAPPVAVTRALDADTLAVEAAESVAIRSAETVDASFPAAPRHIVDILV
jgi:hypothetical protein